MKCNTFPQRNSTYWLWVLKKSNMRRPCRMGPKIIRIAKWSDSHLSGCRIAITEVVTGVAGLPPRRSRQSSFGGAGVSVLNGVARCVEGHRKKRGPLCTVPIDGVSDAAVAACWRAFGPLRRGRAFVAPGPQLARASLAPTTWLPIPLLRGPAHRGLTKRLLHNTQAERETIQ